MWCFVLPWISLVISEVKHFKHFYVICVSFFELLVHVICSFLTIFYFSYRFIRTYCKNLNSLSFTCCRHFYQVNICIQCLLMSFISRSNLTVIKYISISFLLNFFFILTWGHFFIAFRERGRERNIDVKEKHRLVAFPMHVDQDHSCLEWGLNLQPRYVPWLGIKPHNLLVMEQCSNQLSHTSQGPSFLILFIEEFSILTMRSVFIYIFVLLLFFEHLICKIHLKFWQELNW